MTPIPANHRGHAPAASNLTPTQYHGFFAKHCDRTKNIIQDIVNLQRSTPMKKIKKLININAKIEGKAADLVKRIDEANAKFLGLIGKDLEVPATAIRCQYTVNQN
jgi:hypothetical protein